MTDLAEHGVAAPPGQAALVSYGRRATLMAAMAAAAWAAAMGLVLSTVVVMASWASAGGATGASSALRVASATWLLSQHVGIAVGPLPSVHLGIVPLGLLLVPALLLVRAGQSVARVVGLRGWRDGWLAIGGMAATYAAIAGVVAGMTTSTSVRPAPLQSLLVPWALALVCGTVGALRHDRLGARLLHRLPRAVGDAVRAGAKAVLTLVALSACLVVLMLLGHIDLATRLSHSLHAGAIGDGALLVVNAAFLLTAVAWALAYLVGTGFSIGVHTGVSPFAHHLGAVPDLPVLAAVPSGPSPGWAPLLIALPVLAGVLAGWRLAGRSRRLAWWQLPLVGLGAGVTAGLLVAAITGVSGGPAGNGRLVTLGPSAWQAGLAAAVEIGGAAAVVALFRRLAAPYAALPVTVAGHARRIVAGGPDLIDLTPETPQGPTRGPIPAPPAPPSPPPYPGG
ncbi:hypothetical protein acdb102_06640 [Acidothermaceae bacterium B102]|nr:hypothetical protein acdb102_06640 [Acidothermaceae bacterium B102]